MGRVTNGLLGAAALAGVMAFSGNASALETEEQGTLKIGAERLLGFGLMFPNGGGAEFGMTLLPAASPLPLQFPRIGADYFIIDGLSLGGNAGMSFWSGGGGQVGFIFLPRVGYEFEIADNLDFWPRGGFGVVGNSNATSPYLAVEAMFQWKFMPKKLDRVELQFGPTLDAAFDFTVDLAANAGLTIELLP